MFTYYFVFISTFVSFKRGNEDVPFLRKKYSKLKKKKTNSRDLEILEAINILKLILIKKLFLIWG